MAKATSAPAAPSKSAELFDTFATTIGAILDDHLADASMIAAVEAQLAGLKKALAGRFATLEKEVKSLQEELDERDETIGELRGEISDLDRKYDEDIESKNSEISQLQEQVEKVEDTNGCLVVRIDNMLDRDRVEDFLSTKIFPHYNQQEWKWA